MPSNVAGVPRPGRHPNRSSVTLPRIVHVNAMLSSSGGQNRVAWSCQVVPSFERCDVQGSNLRMPAECAPVARCPTAALRAGSGARSRLGRLNSRRRRVPRRSCRRSPVYVVPLSMVVVMSSVRGPRRMKLAPYSGAPSASVYRTRAESPFEGDLDLEPGERSTDADMYAAADRQMMTGSGATRVELGTHGRTRHVAFRSGEHHEQPVAGFRAGRPPSSQ